MADEDDLRTRAIEVLRRDGYGAVTMKRIADELGISVRTLHRYFPAKADIVWGGIEGALDALRRALSEADDALPPWEAISAAILSVFAQDADAFAVGRARMRLIATEPELESTRPETYRQWRDETIGFFSRRLGLPADDVVPQAAAAALQSTIMAALAWWAVQDDETLTPADTVARALDGLASVARAEDPERRS
ncbi:acyl-CoA-like ligand-binding transcription factor [Leifsonia sp. 21MFCrub1.1]|uniref:acyl-CoA-like ligand-binding transcription factor n=1 Tax=Leifsonia sp. 21MFCrub1.1 TaxID=1798223 RepID=UPI0008929CEE|nr:TetR family transcriptional regulator [Leifsonia sp. 21MFCrub1.1]SEB08522.1 DNA-binding transcriptional regulator, AcrR family [Leifsonia sp. 21MFCrub1.1]